MYPRLKRVRRGDQVHEYVQLVEGRREAGKVRQRVVATLGRLDELKASGQLDRWAGAFTRLDPPAAGVHREVGPLLVVAHYLRRLGLVGLVDAAAPMRGRAQATHGEVIAALVANRLSGPAPLYDVAGWAGAYAVAELLGVPAGLLNDDRLGRALDALAPVVEDVRARTLLATLERFEVEASRLHLDLTAVRFAGAYLDSALVANGWAARFDVDLPGGIDALPELDHVAQREQHLPSELRTRYRGQLVDYPAVDPKTKSRHAFRVAYTWSSEEARSVADARERALAKAEAALAKVRNGLGGRYYKTVADVEKRVARVVGPKIEPLLVVTVGKTRASKSKPSKPTLAWRRNPAAIAAAARLDGLYALATNLPDRPDRPLTAQDVLDTYKDQWIAEMVFPQLAKARVRALGCGGQRVADLDLAVGHDHPVDEQLHQQPPLGERGRGQPVPAGPAETLDPVGDSAKLQPLLRDRVQLVLLVGQGGPAALQLPSLALELAQGDDLGQVGVQQPLLLALQLRDGLADGALAGVQLLRQPLPTTGPRQRRGNLGRISQQRGQVSPDQLVQLRGGGVAGGAALPLGAPQRVGAAHADVVVVAVLGRAGGARQAAGAAADQRPQQVGVAGVARGALLVGVQLGLHLGEGLLAHDLRDRDGDPLLRRPGRVALARADRQQRGFALPGGRDPGPVGLRPAGIGRVAQDAAHAGDVPARLARRGRNPQIGQPLSQPVQRHPRLQIPVEQLRDQHRLVRLDSHPGHLAGPLRVHPVAKRRPGPRQQRAGPQPRLPPTTHPLGDQGALVLGHRPADLQQQLVVRILAHRSVQELHPAAVPSQLIDQQHLVDVVAGQPVRRDHQDHVQVGQRGVVAQPVQARTAKAGAAVAVVTVDMLLIQDPATLTHRSTQPLKLLLDGLRLGLAAGGDPRIHPHAHQAPPVASAPPPGRRRAAPSPSAPAAGRPGPNGGRRRGGG